MATRVAWLHRAVGAAPDTCNEMHRSTYRRRAWLLFVAMDTRTFTPEGLAWELRFASFFDPGRGFSFPCDAGGHVDLDSLSERLRNSYFYARAVVGRELAAPAVHAVQAAVLTH
jgi:hypothetical protein